MNKDQKVNMDPNAKLSLIERFAYGVSDLVMGRIVDKTHSKWEKARPWLLLLFVPLSVFFLMMVSIPSGLA